MQKNQPQHYSLHDDDYPLPEDDSIFHWIPEVPQQPIVLHKENILISRDVLEKKYFEAFNFYFSKPINEILANLSLPHVIMYKDYLYYDDESEYLKRYYRLDEVPPRLLNLSKFYNSTSEGLSKPNLAVHEQNKIILKRNHKLHKYYLKKMDDFPDIPQTQRNHKPKEDFKILNNLHDEDGYSEDIYRHAKLKEENLDHVVEDDHDVVHNSFQQMLEQYENATAKVSFDSAQHNVYDPENSGGSQTGDQKSTEENISFEESIELYAKGLSLNTGGNQRFVDTRATEKTHGGNGDTEDQIPHNMSDFALSDASELNLINEMMKNQKDDRLVARITNNIEMRGYKEKANAIAHKQDGNTQVEKEQEKQKAAAAAGQKMNVPKSKSVAMHLANKQSENYAKTAKTSIEKPKTPKAFDVRAPEGSDKPLKSSERNLPKELVLEKAASQGHPGGSSKREKDDMYLDKSQPSARNLETFEKVSPRDLQYPIISIKNLQLNPSTHPLDYRSNTVQFDDRNFSGKQQQKTVPQMIKKSLSKKLSVPETKATLERPAPPGESGQGIKGLMEKYQKHPEEVTSRSKTNLDKGKDANTSSKSRGNFEELVDKYQRMGADIYTNSDLYSRVAQKADPKAALQLNRAKTDDLTPSNNKSKKLSKESPTKMFETQPTVTRRVILSPTSPRKDKIMQRFGSDGGLSPRLMNGPGKLMTQLSSEHSKSTADNLAEEKPLSASAHFKSVKVEKVFAYKRTEMKPPMKTGIMKTDGNGSGSTHSNTRRLTAAHTGSGTPSVEKNDQVTSMPVSPNKKFDLKLNLNKLNQLPGRYQPETTTENSYGFWSSRSAKLPTDEESRLRQSGGITDDRYNKKDYLLKKNYDPYADTKKKDKGLKKGGSFTNAGSTQGFKLRESESHRNPMLLKSGTQEGDLHQIYVQDLHEVNSAGRQKVKDFEGRLEGQLVKSNDYRRQSKK